MSPSAGARQPRRAASIAATSIFFIVIIAVTARGLSAAGGHGLGAG